MTLLILAFLLFILASLVLGDNGAAKRANDNLLAIEPHGKEIKNAIAEMDAFLSGTEYFNNRKRENWIKRYKNLADKSSFDFEKATTNETLKELVRKFQEYYQQGRKLVDEYNENFLKKESEKISLLLDKLEIKSTEDQRKSMACGEDHTLVVAGAGTGKTQTIWGKVAYLCEIQKIKPEEILLLSFTKKATKELDDRVSKIDENLKINTFNALGYEIIGKVAGKRPSVAFGNNIDYQRFINETFNNNLLSDSGFAKLAINYFFYYLYPVKLLATYETKNEYYRSLKNEKILTFRKEVVKSAQEAMIANFLYMHQIEYKYEKLYKYDTSDKDYAQYRPDFYLVDYDIYLEHFGIDRDGNTHFTRDEIQNANDSLKYAEGMEYKRKLHKINKTSLIETYSYEFQEKGWEQKLTRKLEASGVKLHKRSEAEVLAEIGKGEYIRLITPLICTFLNLIKSKNYSLETIEVTYEKIGDMRGMAFMQIFKPILKSYTEYLHEDHSIDFNDMILNAAEYVRKNSYTHNFKHIIIDEFQDFSFSKHSLIQAMLEQNPETKLFCVGDDWQSIFRFSGSDVNLMFDFEKYFGFTRTFRLEECHRFNNQLAKISNSFILKNKHQLRKNLRSSSDLTVDPIQIVYKENDKDSSALENVLKKIDDFAGINHIIVKDVFLLGRYVHDKPANLHNYKYRNIKHIEFFTIHQSKGLTCDFAIILNNTTGKYGFPSNIADDPLIDSVLSESDPFPHSEERRLMYVAMTRARHQVFLLVDKRFQSPFVDELERNTSKNKDMLLCSDCGGVMKPRQSRFGQFWGCSNFPLCQHTKKLGQSVGYADSTEDNQDIVIEMSQ